MKVGYRVLIFCTLLLRCINSISALSTNGDLRLSLPEAVSKYGYPVEIFENIRTEDGYLLTLFRIPKGKNKTDSVNSKKPILLMHALGTSSWVFLLMGPKAGPAYLLADRGYDVWLGNMRGTTYSRKHVSLNADVNHEYWNFSWHEIGVYDLPVMIDFIKKVTKQRQIFYIGISQGTTVSYVLASERSKYNADISLMVSLAPVAFVENISSQLLVTIAKFHSLISTLSIIVGISEFPPRPISELLDLITRTICADIFSVNGENNRIRDVQAAICMLYGDGLNPISFRQIIHYGQNVNSGGFNKYDFGVAKNLKIYGVPNPPSYNLSKITAPVALFHSIGDTFAQPKDVNRLCDGIANCVYNYEIPFRNFDHNDFILSKDVVPLIYEKVFPLLDKYYKEN